MQQDKDLKDLDELIADLGGSNDAGRRSRGSCDYLLERLQAARRNLLGSMPGEYRLSLQQAKESVAICVSDKRVRIEIRKRLRSLMDSEVPRQPSSATSSPEDLVPGPILPAPVY